MLKPSRSQTQSFVPFPTLSKVKATPLTRWACQVIGTVIRITRAAATLSLLTVDGRPCRPDFAGVIRAQDVRMTAKDTVKVWNCFRPGDVVRAKVVRLLYWLLSLETGDEVSRPAATDSSPIQISLGDSRSCNSSLAPILKPVQVSHAVISYQTFFPLQQTHSEFYSPSRHRQALR